MSIDDEKPITFTNSEHVEATYTIKELVGLRPTCSDNEYEKRISICQSCDKFVANEICTENGELVRLNCRLEQASCPLAKW